MDNRITVKTSLDGVEYLAIDGRGLQWFWSERPFGTKTYRLRAVLDGDRIRFAGGWFGDHSLESDETITSAERVEAHWRGYVKATEDRLLGR